MGPKKDNEQILQKIRERRAKKVKKRRKHYLIWKEKNKGVSADVLKLKKNIENSRKVKFPIVFSLRDNIHETIKFINNLKELKESKKSIYLNMKCVEKITNGTIALLLSVINDPSFDGINIIGSKPKNKEARKILELSGFYEHTQAILEFDNENNSNTIIAKSRKAVEPQRSATIVRNAMKTITNKEQRNKKLQGLFIELMANSINHGFPDNGNKKWLLSASHYALEKRVSFSFIDNGVGILKTLDIKLGKKLISFFTGNNDLLLSAFRGEIGSRTGLDFRGKGLPFILEKQRLGYIVNLFVLTNNVILDFEKNDFYEIDINYSGTFYFFEINNNCEL